MSDADTNKSAEWIARALAANPVKATADGTFLTCPVRLSFPNIFARSRPIPPNTEGKYGANIVFPVGADLSVLEKAVNKAVTDKWPNAGQKGGPKIKSPWKQQADMMDRYDGYEEDGVYISATSDRQPPVYTPPQQLVTDPDRIYPGVWAIVQLRTFAYDKGVNKGVSFGLQDLMIVAEDKRLGGGGSSPAAYAGIQIDADASSDSVFGSDEDAAAAKLFS